MEVTVVSVGVIFLLGGAMAEEGNDAGRHARGVLYQWILMTWPCSPELTLVGGGGGIAF